MIISCYQHGAPNGAAKSNLKLQTSNLKRETSSHHHILTSTYSLLKLFTGFAIAAFIA
jgi:hypothetical protein